MASTFQKDFPVPENFPLVLHDFAREILRVQPECILSFGVEYFEKIQNNESMNFASKYNVSRQEQTAHFRYAGQAAAEEQQQVAQVQQSQDNQQELNFMASSYLSNLKKNSVKELHSVENLSQLHQPQTQQQPILQPHKQQPPEEDDEKTLVNFKLRDD